MGTSTSEDRSVRSGRPSSCFRIPETGPEREASPPAQGAAWDRWLAVFAILGLTLRLIRFLSDRPLWGDEAMVAVNVLGRSFADLARPLAFFQVAPVGFLWIERAAIEAWGASTMVLRLAPAACGLAAVPLFSWLARRAVGGTSAMLAVAIFAVSYAPIRHMAEVKPYAFDLFTSLILCAPALSWLRNPDRRGPLWVLVLVAPIAMACSHPSVFVAGGIGLAMTPHVWRRGGSTPGLRLPWSVYLLVVPLAFAGLYLLSTKAQSEAVGSAYRLGYWSDEFPPISEPLRLIGWFVATHAGAAFGYPIGGERGGSILSTVLAIIGVSSLVRGGRLRLAILLIAPLGLTLLASAIGRYPYGGSARTMQHATPAICLLVGIGGSALIGRIADPGRRSRILTAVIALLCLIGSIQLVGDLARPYRTIEDQRTRDFARWFWPEMARDAEVGCARAMRGTTFEGTYWRLGRLELYLSNRELYLPPGRDPARPRLDRVSAGRPLRCVVYNDDPAADPRLAAWLDSLSGRFQLRDVRSYTVNGGIVDSGMPREERFLVYEFVPNESRAPLSISEQQVSRADRSAPPPIRIGPGAGAPSGTGPRPLGGT